MPENSGVSGIGVAVLFAGGILVWSGVRGYSVSHIGKQPTYGQPDNPVSIGGLLNPLQFFGGGSGNTSVTSTGGSVSGTAAQNKKLGQKMAKSFGWDGGAQWIALNNIIMSESGWSDTAANSTSNARGIGQNINGWSSIYQEGNAAQQIMWTYRYIKQRYGNPVNAWNFHQAHGWY
jgi:hypothetical protein